MNRCEIRLYRFERPDKERPVLILTRETSISHLLAVSEVILDLEDGVKARCAVNLHNVVTVPQASVGRRVASLGAARMDEVCLALRFSLGCG
jgi:mRNA-degrading endonuclease toxin of MazEF toxin-antitoxin module